MRSAGRRLNGWSADERWRCRETNATSSAKESTEAIRKGDPTGVCRSTPWIVRSGILALGKEVSGHPLQSDASLISLDAETDSFEQPFALSRAQIETQAPNIHMKPIGSSAAINLLGLRRVIDIVKIIHIRFAFRQSSPLDVAHGCRNRAATAQTQGCVTIDRHEQHAASIRAAPEPLFVRRTAVTAASPALPDSAETTEESTASLRPDLGTGLAE